MYGYPSSIVVDECDDTTVNVNSVQEGTFPSGSTLDIEVTDGTDPVTPDAVIVTGNTIEIQVPAAVSRTTATLMKTGQTTSYRTGDDGDLEAGRATSFTALDTAPLHNNGAATLNATTNRFTDILGGQTYADDIVLDWSTWNGSTLLGWYRVPTLANTTGWDEAIDGCLAASHGGFNIWRLGNIIEIYSIMRFDSTNNTSTYYGYNYAPFNLSSDYTYWSSTTYALNTLQAYYTRPLTKQMGFTNKNTLTYYYLQVRTFSLSTLNVLS